MLSTERVILNINILVVNLARNRCIFDNFECLNANVRLFITVTLSMTVFLAEFFNFDKKTSSYISAGCWIIIQMDFLDNILFYNIYY